MSRMQVASFNDVKVYNLSAGSCPLLAAAAARSIDRRHALDW